MLRNYKSHKIVKAAKITGMNHGKTLTLDGMNGLFNMDPDPIFWKRNEPEIGGYFVQYEDGFQSYSPARAFEQGYTEVNLNQGLDSPI
jgi:hypothetical protein